MLPVQLALPATAAPELVAAESPEETFAAMLQAAGLMAPPALPPQATHQAGAPSFESQPSPDGETTPTLSAPAADAVIARPGANQAPSGPQAATTDADPTLMTMPASPAPVAPAALLVPALDAAPVSMPAPEGDPLAGNEPPRGGVPAPQDGVDAVHRAMPAQHTEPTVPPMDTTHGVEQFRELIAAALRVQQGRGVAMATGKPSMAQAELAPRASGGARPTPEVAKPLSASGALETPVAIESVSKEAVEGHGVQGMSGDASEHSGTDESHHERSASHHTTDAQLAAVGEPDTVSMPSALSMTTGTQLRMAQPVAQSVAPRSPVSPDVEAAPASRVVVVPFETPNGEASRLRIALVGDSVRATILTSAAAAPALDAALPELRQALSDRGFNDAHVVVRATGIEAAAGAPRGGDPGTSPGTDRRTPDQQAGYDPDGRRQDRDASGRQRRHDPREESAQ